MPIAFGSKFDLSPTMGMNDGANDDVGERIGERGQSSDFHFSALPALPCIDTENRHDVDCGGEEKIV